MENVLVKASGPFNKKMSPREDVFSMGQPLM